MQKKTRKIFKSIKTNKWLQVSLGLFVASTMIIVPSIFYGTTSKFLYKNAIGNIINTSNKATEENVFHEFKGSFIANQKYSKGDVIEVKEVKFSNELLRSEVSTVYNNVMYEFTEDWTGDSLENAPIKKYDPKNLTTYSIPLSQYIIDNKIVDSYMGNSYLLAGLGKSSVTGKFNGSGSSYDSSSKPGYATIDQTKKTVSLSGLSDFFTWSSVFVDYDNPIVASAINSYPTLDSTAAEKQAMRYEFDKVGLYAVQFSNEDASMIKSQWASSVNGSSYTKYMDMSIGQIPSIEPTFSRLSTEGSTNYSFTLDDENLGMYIYSKSANFPLATRYACQNNILNASYTGFYHGVGELLIDDEDDDTVNPHYIGQHRTVSITVRTPSGDIPVNVDYDAAMGYYIYSRTGISPKRGDGDPLSSIANFNADPLNYERDINYYNGFFSLNRPEINLDRNEQQEIRWYVPLASTDFKASINQGELIKYQNTMLATDAMRPDIISHFYDPILYNAIPSTFYGGQLTVTADNTTGTIWIEFQSGPTAEVSNGVLYEKAVYPQGGTTKPSWLLGMNWVYNDGSDDKNKYSAYWRDNTTNTVSEVDLGKSISYTTALTGFPKVSPTKITSTTGNSKLSEFIPGVSNDPEAEYYSYRLTSTNFTQLTATDYIEKQKKLPDSEQYADLLRLIFTDLVYNKGPIGVTTTTGGAFITDNDLVKVSDATPFNFVNEDREELGGRLQFSVSLKKYFDSNGTYVDGQGGFASVPVLFSGFKAVPGPTSVNVNYNLNTMILGGATTFNKANQGGNGINYPSDYVQQSWLDPSNTGNLGYTRLVTMIEQFSRSNPFKGDDFDAANNAFSSLNYMINNLPDKDDEGNSAFTINEGSVEYNNFSGYLKITPTFNRYYSNDGTLITGVNTTLGTITISGFQQVNGLTTIPGVVTAISTSLQPSAIVTKINGVDQVDGSGNYIGEELYKIAWNEAINLPSKGSDSPVYDTNTIATTELEEIKRAIDIRVLPNDPTWVNNVDGYLKFAVAFRKYFDNNGVPQQVTSNNLWPSDWQTGGTEVDNVHIVTVYGYANAPGPTGILQSENGTNRNVTLNQPNFQPSEFIKNDENAGFALLRSVIAGNLTNLPSDFTVQDIVLSVDEFNNSENVQWDPTTDGELPLTASNKAGTIKVQVYLKKWYDDNSKLCNYKEDNKGLPYTNVDWNFTISGFMNTTATGATNLAVTDLAYTSANKNTIDLSDQNIYNFFASKYPEIAELKNYLPYQVATPSKVSELIMIKNKGSNSSAQPYLLMTNVPENIKSYNISVTTDNITIDNKSGSFEFSVTFRQWFTNDSGQVIYHPTLSDTSSGITEYVTTQKINITGLEKVNNATVIAPTGDIIDNATGIISMTNTSTSAKIVQGILNGKNPGSYVDSFKVDELQPILLNDDDLRVYLYVALVESGGSPYTYTPGSMVEKKDDGSFVVNDLEALREFISWKIDPYYDLMSGSVIMYPMLNLWFGGDDVQIYSQYQSFGAGNLGKPTILTGTDGKKTVQPAKLTSVTLTGFLAASGAVRFQGSTVYNGSAIVSNISDASGQVLDLSGYTAEQYIKKVGLYSLVSNIQVSSGGIVGVVNESVSDLTDITNLIDFNDPHYYKVNLLNGTIEVKTKKLIYFDSNLVKQQGSVTLVISGFKPSVSAYNATYIVLIVLIISIVIIFAIVLARILWVRYNRTRQKYKN